MPHFYCANDLTSNIPSPTADIDLRKIDSAMELGMLDVVNSKLAQKINQPWDYG